jgi:hypothetical protein
MATLEIRCHNGIARIETLPEETAEQAGARLSKVIEELGGAWPEVAEPEGPRPLTMNEQVFIGMCLEGAMLERILVYMQLDICRRRRALQFEDRMGMEQRRALEQLPPRLVPVGSIIYDVVAGARIMRQRDAA